MQYTATRNSIEITYRSPVMEDYENEILTAIEEVLMRDFYFNARYYGEYSIIEIMDLTIEEVTLVVKILEEMIHGEM